MRQGKSEKAKTLNKTPSLERHCRYVTMQVVPVDLVNPESYLIASAKLETLPLPACFVL